MFCHKSTSAIIGVAFLIAAGNGLAFGEDGPSGASGPRAVRSLHEFGPLTTLAEVKAAYQKAKEEMLQEGGVLLVPANANKLYREENTSQLSDRRPPAPAETKGWKRSGPGITVVVVNRNGAVVQGPSIDGLTIERTLRMPLDDSLPHWSTDAAVKINNNLVHGSNSYRDWLAEEEVPAGKDARFYVRTIRGLRPGMFLNLHAGSWDGTPLTRGCIKTLGYDPEKKLHYFTADTEISHRAGAILHNKNNEGVMWMQQKANCDEQTYDIMLNRWQYALGDTYMFFARYRYMSNIHSAAGDENGNIFGAYTESLANSFMGAVETTDWNASTVKFAPGAGNVDTLGTSRTLINLNPKKHITQGKVIVVPAESYWDTIDTGKYPFEGKTYPTTIINGGLHMGGLIRGDRDCPWDDSIIGRYFGITERTELIPRSTKIRWYEVAGLTVNPDGTKDITIQRFWWGAKTMASPTLYRLENNTWDGHIRPLSYVIAPGTYVSDVTRAVPGPGAPNLRTLGVAPYRDMKTSFDFEKGDAIEQAVGPDPFKPTAIRIWMQDNVPSVFPASVLDLNNSGADPRYAAMWVRGGPKSLEGLANLPRQLPLWENVVVMSSAVGVGINCQADFSNAAILFQQPNREQPIKWYYGERELGKPASEATLTVSRENGDLSFNGGDARFSGSLVAKGLSSDEKPARNLRGKNVVVKAGEMTVAISFPVEESDADYAVFVEQNWISNRAVVKKESNGFTVQFEKAAPDGAKLDWMIVR